MYNHPEFKDDAAFEARLEALPAHVVYGQLTGRESWADKMAELIPQHMHMGFVRYIAYGGPRSNNGHFLRALMNNDLMGAYGRADSYNAAAIPNWVTFLYNYAPRCYGYPDAYDQWEGILAMYREEEDA